MADSKKVETNKLNIYQKLQKSRVDLQGKKLKKTGVNKYSNYDYFELGDFLPSINEICNANGLATIFHFTSELATLTVVDVDNLESKLEFTTPVEIASLKGCSSIQNIGGTQSYARRYLYIMAFEIAESDIVDGGEIDQNSEHGKKKIDKAAAFVINKLIDETKTEKSKFLEWIGVAKVEDITNDCLSTCMSQLNKKKEAMQKAAQKNKNEFPEELNL
ncbi:ERF family protein [Clostridium botulinum]|uniref:ERF family protein n=1 Tax=Clostridium botulinum TaxID=1491 RepID=UPI0013F7AAA3|nr:ERF family protein [Clostridium botulinum]MBY6789243.1 ERF family protein [Clostridium botulinum]MBY6946592.1 ERF family protein [Clostridium botulinum]MBY7020220.1 ERF family protein [Clostridium botulinum]NFG76224.1 recombinase [Clostridium botulinum]NFI33215.1 recombinase [Clostridium botulinum]